MKKIAAGLSVIFAAFCFWIFKPHNDVVPKRPRTSYTLPQKPRKFKPNPDRLHPKLRQWMKL